MGQKKGLKSLGLLKCISWTFFCCWLQYIGDNTSKILTDHLKFSFQIVAAGNIFTVYFLWHFSIEKNKYIIKINLLQTCIKENVLPSFLCKSNTFLWDENVKALSAVSVPNKATGKSGNILDTIQKNR